MVAQVGEPSSFRKATQHQVWEDAMVEEYSSIMTNDVWEVVPRPQNRSVVGSRWIYKTQKWIWEFSSGLGDIKLINYFNEFPKLKLRELK